MRRRAFNTLLGGACVAGPLGVLAQQARLPRIGVLMPANPEAFLGEFRKGVGIVGIEKVQVVDVLANAWRKRDCLSPLEILRRGKVVAEDIVERLLCDHGRRS